MKLCIATEFIVHRITVTKKAFKKTVIKIDKEECNINNVYNKFVLS